MVIQESINNPPGCELFLYFTPMPTDVPSKLNGDDSDGDDDDDDDDDVLQFFCLLKSSGQIMNRINRRVGYNFIRTVFD